MVSHNNGVMLHNPYSSNRGAQRLINHAVNQGYLEEIEQKGALEKIGRMAERKSIRGRRVFAERKARRIS